jgi:hypothetical protein
MSSDTPPDALAPVSVSASPDSSAAPPPTTTPTTATPTMTTTTPMTMTKTAPKEKTVLSDEMQRVFRELVTCYDRHEWKRGVRTADRILEEFPTHGETVAMKGLIVHSLGAARRAEAHELAKLALRYDIRSHVCVLISAR